MKKLLSKGVLLVAVIGLLAAGCSSSDSTSSGSNTNPSGSSYKQTSADSQFQDNNQPEVKKSSTGICHAKGSTYYNRTLNFTPYNSISDCLASGGRLPKK